MRPSARSALRRSVRMIRASVSVMRSPARAAARSAIAFAAVAPARASIAAPLATAAARAAANAQCDASPTRAQDRATTSVLQPRDLDLTGWRRRLRTSTCCAVRATRRGPAHMRGGFVRASTRLRALAQQHCMFSGSLGAEFRQRLALRLPCLTPFGDAASHQASFPDRAMCSRTRVGRQRRGRAGRSDLLTRAPKAPWPSRRPEEPSTRSHADFPRTAASPRLAARVCLISDARIVVRHPAAHGLGRRKQSDPHRALVPVLRTMARPSSQRPDGHHDTSGARGSGRARTAAAPGSRGGFPCAAARRSAPWTAAPASRLTRKARRGSCARCSTYPKLRDVAPGEAGEVLHELLSSRPAGEVLLRCPRRVR